MPMGGDGPVVTTLMWGFVAIAFVFVLMRLYTRLVLAKLYGIDDHFYNIASTFLLLYVIFIHISAKHGFGQPMAEIEDPNDISAAILSEAIGQVMAVIGMAVAKLSVGFFLLRIVQVAWQRTVIIVAMGVLVPASVSVVFVFMLQCTPPAYLWDRTIEGGYCHVDTTPVSLVLCILCVICDFLFAILPWFFVRGLQMKQREKRVILSGLSLGFIAGVCGIKRTLEVPSLAKTQNYLKDTVGLIIWSAAEMTLTLVCTSIPVLRPLYRGFRDGGHREQDGNGNGDARHSGLQFALHTIGGSNLPRSGRVVSPTDPTTTIMGIGGPDDGGSDGNLDIERGVWATYENRSSEEILGQKC